MKTNKTMKPLKLVFLAIAFALALTAFIPAVGKVDAQAKTTKISTGSKWQKAPMMKKTGTYAVTQKKTDASGFGYVAFTAPKAGTYKVTISNMKALNSSRTFLSNWYICKASASGSYLLSEKVKTEGGSSSCLWTASQNYDNKYISKGKLVNRYLKTRSATIKLKKGEKIYSKYWGTTPENKFTYTITIKKTK